MDDTRRVSGRAVVVVMFLFGIAATSILFFYWEAHTAPFRALQTELAETFTGSKPRVDGGQRKSHKGTPKTLRVVMQVEFDPDADERTAEAFADEVMLVAARHGLTKYEVLEIHLYWPEPEARIHERTLTRAIAER